MTPLRAVIWCAVSSNPQAAEDKDSLPVQESQGRALCEREAWRAVDVLVVPGHSRDYIDIHECAHDMAQKGINAFTTLIDLWERRAFDVLIVRDGERFARTQSLHAYVTEKTISIGARIYSFSDGWIDKKNFRMFAAMGGYKAASDIDRLKEFHRMGMDKAARDGLPTSWKAVMSHKLIRNEQGKRIGLEVDESKRRLWDDLGSLLLDHKSWSDIDRLLYEQYGHVNPNTGRRYGPRCLYKVVYNPYFWGHSGRHYDGKYGLWVFDPSEPLPEGVTLHYNTHQAVWTGEFADAIRAELRRRHDIAGKTQPDKSHRFTGLLECADCHSRLSYSKHIYARKDGTYYTAWMCFRHWVNGSQRPTCNQNKLIREDKVIRYVDGVLRQLIGADRPDLFIVTEDNGADVARRIRGVEKDLAEADKRLADLIEKQIAAPAAAQYKYAEKIEQTGAQIDILRRNLANLQRTTESPSVRANRQKHFEALKSMGLPTFWAQEPTYINQVLHAIIGKYRFIVDQGEIVRIRPAHIWR